MEFYNRDYCNNHNKEADFNNDYYHEQRKNCCVKKVEETLREEGINTQFFLVGSGARNMVTQNENKPIDFDYNLNVLSVDGSSDIDDWNEKDLKHSVIITCNKVMRSFNMRDVDDSTSSITTKPMHYNDEPHIEFSIDICIVTKVKNQWYRLIHEKGFNSFYDKYYWNEAPHSHNYQRKSFAIKSVPGWWEKVRDEYLNIKNHYLRRNDHDHPSFVCYIEAVNNIYNQMKQLKLV